MSGSSNTNRNRAKGRTVQINGAVGNRRKIMKTTKPKVNARARGSFVLQVVQQNFYGGDNESSMDTDPVSMVGQLTEHVVPRPSPNPSTPTPSAGSWQEHKSESLFSSPNSQVETIASECSTQGLESDVDSSSASQAQTAYGSMVGTIRNFLLRIDDWYQIMSNGLRECAGGLELPDLLQSDIEDPRTELQSRGSEVLELAQQWARGELSPPKQQEPLQSCLMLLYTVSVKLGGVLAVLGEDPTRLVMLLQAMVEFQGNPEACASLAMESGGDQQRVASAQLLCRLNEAGQSVQQFMTYSAKLLEHPGRGEDTPATALERYGRRRTASTTLCDLLSEVCHSHREHWVYINPNTKEGSGDDAAEVVFSLAFEEHSKLERRSSSLVWFIARSLVVCGTRADFAASASRRWKKRHRPREKNNNNNSKANPNRVRKAEKRPENREAWMSKPSRTHGAAMPATRRHQRTAFGVKICPAGLRQGEGGECAIQLPSSYEAGPMEHKLIFPSVTQLPGSDMRLVPLAAWIEEHERGGGAAASFQIEVRLSCIRLARLIVEAIMEIPLGVFSTSHLRSDHIAVLHPAAGAARTSDPAAANLEPHLRVRLASKALSTSAGPQSLSVQLASSRNVLFGLCVVLLELASLQLIQGLGYGEDSEVSERSFEVERLRSRVRAAESGGVWPLQPYCCAVRYCFESSTSGRGEHNLFSKESLQCFYKEVVLELREAEKFYEGFRTEFREIGNRMTG